jgi:3-hydroxyacyl-CoA dehydrogenase/enoyl-CoA hydratase/3-hydroxybutyryl-CoA epimerase
MSAMTATDQPGTGATGSGRVNWHVDADGVAVLRLGSADEHVVTLTRERILSLDQALSELQQRTALRGLIVTGPGPGMFCAGADINLIERIATPAEGAEAARTGRKAFARLQQLPVPVIAAIEGPCVGGALELVLFADVRVASDHQATQIGLPEVKLGIVPGFGGSQNLPRLIGLPAALDLILQGKLLKPSQARRSGVIDRVVPQARLMAAAREELEKLWAKKRKAPERKLRGAAFWLSRTPLRYLVQAKVRRTLQKGQGRFYPAPSEALALCVRAFAGDREAGFAAEAEALGRTICTPASKGLVHLFFLTERSKKLGRPTTAVPDLQRAMVVGGGVMGAGIAGLLAQKGVKVRLCDVDPNALVKAKQRLQQELSSRVQRRRMEPHEATAVQDRLAASTEWGSLQQTDLWLEAVVEDLAVKHKLMAEAVKRGLRPDAVIATNTSSLSIERMAAELPSPERVVGIHFFNPPDKMPLIEVVRGPRTGDRALGAACRLAVRLGKYPIVVKDSPGFLVNRCLAPYVNEAARLLFEGCEPEAVDQVMLDFGMPMGPVRLCDEIGYDVAAKVSEVLAAAFGDRMQPQPLFAAMVAARALGKKSGGGIYGPDGKGRGPGRKVLEELQSRRRSPTRTPPPVEVMQRLLYPMINESYRCLDEAVVRSPEDLDLGLVMGIGFPPFTGGLTRFAVAEGLKNVVAALDDLARRVDPSFAPADCLRRRAVE